MVWEAPNSRIGDYPAEYNQKVHGPYDPARYYGPRDTPLGEVKLGELQKWLGRRNFHPRAMVQCASRATWRWRHKYVFPVRSNAAFLYQFIFCTSIFYYTINYKKFWDHAHYKYH
ncbi:putative ATP synthase subunit f, mitochondrial [Thrips palmi]|uniref:ATP synthase subunit f, mitochondrial n=1 Tax=Thrips palmi TaxID=161013 RepID=A0A6P8ZAR5_THRPL|nr:putative ATP synthase subunit f, mitochondrial [Thrips palmi]